MLMQIQENEKLIEKHWGELGQKRVWPTWSQDSKIGFISRRN